MYQRGWNGGRGTSRCLAVIWMGVGKELRNSCSGKCGSYGVVRKRS